MSGRIVPIGHWFCENSYWLQSFKILSNKNFENSATFPWLDEINQLSMQNGNHSSS